MSKQLQPPSPSLAMWLHVALPVAGEAKSLDNQVETPVKVQTFVVFSCENEGYMLDRYGW